VALADSGYLTGRIDGGKLLDRLTTPHGRDRQSQNDPHSNGWVSALRPVYAARVASLRRVMDLLDFEIDLFASLARGRLTADPNLRRGYAALQMIPGGRPNSGRSVRQGEDERGPWQRILGKTPSWAVMKGFR
jgi:hypothetical protein